MTGSAARVLPARDQRARFAARVPDLSYFRPRARLLDPPADAGPLPQAHLEGERAARMERALSESPAQLGQAFARLAAEKAAERRKAQRKQKKPAETKPPRSATEVARIDSAEARGVLVTIRSLDEADRRAVTAILYGREQGRLVVALAVSPEAGAARREAEAAWHGR